MKPPSARRHPPSWPALDPSRGLRRSRSLRFRLRICVWIGLGLAAVGAVNTSAQASDPKADFDSANKLYEQGRYPEAAATYERIASGGHAAEALYFNLGNAWFKSGQSGRAIAAWRHAEALAPRDPGIRFNLQFARRKVSGNDAAAGPLWQRALRTLTLDEWAILASAAVWVWFILLGLRELRTSLRPALRGYTATAGVLTLLLGGCIALKAGLQLQTRSAVVIVPEAIARSGPLEEAKVLQHFRDGAELTILDEKEVTVEGRKQAWYEGQDAGQRSGWVKSDQVLLIR